MTSWTVPGFTEVGEIGRGASGRVVEATTDDSGWRVAIKYLNRSLLTDSSFVTRFRDEARLLTELNVPQVVRFYEYVEQPGQGAAIVMELVDGCSLHDLISHRGPTSPESALLVLKGSLLGLAAAHSLGVVHGDYKPENVLVNRSGVSKLSDFGVAVRVGRRVAATGTPLYMAPEQWEGAPAAPASDIYAATAVFFECLTGRTPFSGRLRQLRHQHEHAPVPSADVDEPLRGLVEQGMAKDPAARPAEAGAFLTELERVAATYGDDWEERGYGQLAARAAALALLLIGDRTAGGAGTSSASTFLSRRRVPVIVGTAAVVIAATAVGTAIAVTHKPARSEPPVTITITAPPRTSAAAVAQTSSPPATPTVTSSSAQPPPSPSASPSPSITPSPTPSPGTLTVSQTYLKLTQAAPGDPYTGSFTLTAVGGPVAYSISVPASEQAYLFLSPVTGTIDTGGASVITATVTPNPAGPPPAYYNTVTVNPGGVTVAIYYPPSG